MKRYTFAKNWNRTSLENAIRLLRRDSPKALSAAAGALHLAYRTLMRCAEATDTAINIQFDPDGSDPKRVVFEGKDFRCVAEDGGVPDLRRFRYCDEMTVTIPEDGLHNHLMGVLLRF